jgi:tetratricopeptide (TPR) repeat protein
VTPPGSATVSRRQLLERHRHVQDEQLRYLQKLGFIQAIRVHGEPHYSFADLTVIRQADTELAEGISFRAVVRNLLASRAGQLAFDFRGEARPAKVLQLTRREPPPFAVLMNLTPPVDVSSAEQHFLDGSRADDGDPEHFDDAMHSYRRALELDPYMVPALINLANIHYARDETVEAQALYERAIALDADVFEAHFNLGNILHDLGRYNEALTCYRDALQLNPSYADAHFYMAVTLEKSGRSQEARPHWRSYQRLAPNGEWVNLAKEFSD